LTGLIPSEVGAAVLAQAETAEAAMATFQRSASDPTKADQGIVRITCSDIFGVEILPPILSTLMARHPLLVIELALSNRTDDLLKREADLAVRLTPPKQAALIAKKVAPVEIGLFAAKRFLQQNPSPKNFKDLVENGRFIGDDRRDLIAKGFTTSRLRPPENLVLRTDSDLAQLAAIRNGVGIGVCQMKIAKTSGLVRVLPGISSQLDCWVVMHEDLKTVKRIKLVFDHLAMHLAKNAISLSGLTPKGWE
jgi:DNA-binding transcriptional LysR family regulator